MPAHLGDRMILAIAALVLQFPAIPPSSLSATALNLDASAASELAGQPVTAADASSTPNAALPDAARASAAVAAPDPGTQPSDVPAFQPGRLTPEPIVATTPATTTTGSAVFPSSPGAVAFLASTPAAVLARQEQQRQRHIWLALSIVQSGAATFDAWSTRRVVSSGQAQEANPLLRPFAGNASLYVAIQAAPLVLDYVGHRMMTSRYGWARHTWWMPQAVGTAMSLASGGYNLSH
jgi:hypothetical protein